MNITTIASGSSGNCYHISDGESSILIECGIQFKKIQKAMNFNLSSVSGCLVSHLHKDHCRAAKDIIKAGIDLYLSEATRKEIGISGHRVKVFESLKMFEVGFFKILPFTLEHDVENHGFLIQSGSDKLVYATDTFYVKYKFNGITHFMIECNYSKEILEENIASGKVPAEIRNRITRSHFELKNVKEFFRANDLSKTREIHLIHRSSSNCPSDVKEQIQAVTGKEVILA